jgi:hypothetical protein
MKMEKMISKLKRIAQSTHLLIKGRAKKFQKLKLAEKGKKS